MLLSPEERRLLVKELQEDLDDFESTEELDDCSKASDETTPPITEFQLSVWVSQAPLDATTILAFRATCRAAQAVVERDCQSWITRLETDFPPRRGETMDLLSVYASAHMRYVLFRHMHKCEERWRAHQGSLWMSWKWFCSRIVRRVSPEMYERANKRAVSGGKHDVGTRSSPRVARLPDPSLHVPAELHTSISKSLDKLCDADWLLVYDQLADELRIRARVVSLSIEVPHIDEDFDIDEALLYLPLWNCSSSRHPPLLSGVCEFTEAESFLENILVAYYDFEDVGKMLLETGGELDFCIQAERECRGRSIVPVRELTRTAFLCGVILDSRMKRAFVWALYCVIHRAASGADQELLREVAEMVARIATYDDRGPAHWRRHSGWFDECVVTPAKMAKQIYRA